MNPTEHTRRTLLKSAVATLCSPGLMALASKTKADLPKDAANPADENLAGSLYISGARQSPDQHVAIVFDEHGRILTSVPLSARAHGAAAHHQTHRGCLFARRPGLYMNTFDSRTPHIHHVVSPVSGRHYYGHGIYSDKGDLLFATENDFDNVRGVVGIYDADNGYQRVGEVNTGGVGPHEVIRVPGSSLLVIANGGIQTHPDSGREKLNIESMHPSLTIIDSRNGKIVAQHFLPDQLHQVSIRHLACTQDGEVWFAGQYEGTDPLVNGLAGVISLPASISSFQQGISHKGLSLIDLPASLLMKSLHYLSSVAVTGNSAIYTAAKGGLAFNVNRKTKQLEDSVSVFDCSGVASMLETNLSRPHSNVSNGAALITSGTGEIVRLNENGTTPLSVHSLQWDNHVYRLS